MKKLSVTAVILVKNEEKNLANCLKRLSWVSKILAIDDYSEDNSLAVAKKYGAEVVQRRLDNFASQRNFALKKVKTEWVLMIDVDEEVTEKLKSEIIRAIKENKFDGFYYPRKNIIFGKWIEHSGWYPDHQLHLFKTKKGKYQNKVHEQVLVKGRVGYLKSHLIHHNYQTISQYLKKIDHYTTLAAEKEIDSGYRFNPEDLLKKPANEFFRRFFAEKGYKDGLHGLVLSLLQALSELVLVLKVWEKEGFKDQELPFSDLLPQMKKLGSETTYWFSQTLIKESKNPVKKFQLKLKRWFSS